MSCHYAWLDWPTLLISPTQIPISQCYIKEIGDNILGAAVPQIQNSLPWIQLPASIGYPYKNSLRMLPDKSAGGHRLRYDDQADAVPRG